MFILQDGIFLFKSLDDKKLIIRNYVNGLVIKINYQDSLKDLLCYLKKPRSKEEIITKFSDIKKDNLLSTIQMLKKYDVISTVEAHKKINVCLIGVGTTGSHIANDLKNLSDIKSLVVVDPDIVSEDNLYRQNYVKSDLNKKKVEVLFERGGRPSIIPIDIMCNNSAKIVDLCKEYKIDIVIQAGDYPSTRELAKLTEIAANELNIPYIINAGYISNVVSLPEFYYPNNVYDFLYKHEIYKEKLIFTNANNKAQSSIVANVGHIVARQISDYCAGKKPFKYRERGFFDIKALEWRTEKIE